MNSIIDIDYNLFLFHYEIEEGQCNAILKGATRVYHNNQAFSGFCLHASEERRKELNKWVSNCVKEFDFSCENQQSASKRTLQPHLQLFVEEDKAEMVEKDSESVFEKDNKMYRYIGCVHFGDFINCWKRQRQQMGVHGNIYVVKIDAIYLQCGDNRMKRLQKDQKIISLKNVCKDMCEFPQQECMEYVNGDLGEEKLSLEQVLNSIKMHITWLRAVKDSALSATWIEDEMDNDGFHKGLNHVYLLRAELQDPTEAGENQDLLEKIVERNSCILGYFWIACIVSLLNESFDGLQQYDASLSWVCAMEESVYFPVPFSVTFVSQLRVTDFPTAVRFKDCKVDEGRVQLPKLYKKSTDRIYGGAAYDVHVARVKSQATRQWWRIVDSYKEKMKIAMVSNLQLLNSLIPCLDLIQEMHNEWVVAEKEKRIQHRKDRSRLVVQYSEENAETSGSSSYGSTVSCFSNSIDTIDIEDCANVLPPCMQKSYETLKNNTGNLKYPQRLSIITALSKYTDEERLRDFVAPYVNKQKSGKEVDDLIRCVYEKSYNVYSCKSMCREGLCPFVRQLPKTTDLLHDIWESAKRGENTFSFPSAVWMQMRLFILENSHNLESWLKDPLDTDQLDKCKEIWSTFGENQVNPDFWLSVLFNPSLEDNVRLCCSRKNNSWFIFNPVSYIKSKLHL